jgi:hypothetical protein
MGLDYLFRRIKMRTTKNLKRLFLIALAVAAVTAISFMWIKPTPAKADSADRVRVARAALEQARGVEKSKPSKDTGRAAEIALQEYNAAVAARRADILVRVGELNELMGLNTTNAFDIRGMVGRRPNLALKAEYDALQTELTALPNAALAPGNLNSLTEVEPNNTSATATPLGLTANNARVGTGAITAADIDFWSFTAPAGARVWAYVDTGGGQSAPTNDRDTFLTLFDTNGTTILEEDDDDGTGNGSDSVTESGFASGIAGRTVAAAGTYFIAVEGFGPTSVIQPYRLFVIVTTGSSAEAEPNNTAATANPGLGAGGISVVKTGSITPAGDADFFSIVANAGDVFYIAGDGNPERDATNTDLILDITHPDGRTLMQPPVDSGLGGSATNPEGESFSIAVPVSGTYAVSVRGFGTSTGTYGLVIARASSVQICPVTTFTGILGQNSVQNPGISGTQMGRLNRFTDQTGACNNVRTCPGTFTTVGERPYDAYTYQNVSANTACVTVEIDAQACLVNNFLVVAAYTGQTYDPANQCTNYLADIGGSPNPLGVMSFNVPGNSFFTLVITAANASPTVCATPYRVTISGLPTFATSIQDPVTGDTLQFNCTAGTFQFTSCSTGTTVSGTIGCIQFGCNLFIGGNKSGVTINGTVNTCTGAGSATITVGGTTFNISDTNVNNNSCSCP